jgi:hypothetical protein
MISDLATGMGVARGGGALEHEGIAFTLEQFDPQSGLRLRMTSILRALARDHFVLEQIGTDAEGEERVVRRTHYHRRKV